MARNSSNQSVADLGRIAIAVACWLIVHYIQQIEETIKTHGVELEKVRSTTTRLEERIGWIGNLKSDNGYKTNAE